MLGIVKFFGTTFLFGGPDLVTKNSFSKKLLWAIKCQKIML